MRGDLLFVACAMSGTLLWGCAVTEHAAVDETLIVPEKFYRGSDTFPAVKLTSRWWEEFRDEELNAIVEESLSASPDVSLALARVSQARASRNAAGSALHPVFNLSARGGADRQPGTSGSHTGTSYRLSFEAAYEVDLWNKMALREKAAMHEEEAAESDAETVYLSLAARVVDLYYLAVEQRAQINHIDQTALSFEDTLARVEDRYRNGLVPALDLYQAQQNLAQARARRPVVEARLARAEHALSVLLGRFPSENAFGILAVLPEAPEQWPEGIPSEVIARRPDVQSALARLQSADAQAAAAVAERFPSFNILAGFGQSHTSLASGNATGLFWNFLAGLAQPLVDGGRREAEIDRTSAVLRERLALYHQSALKAFREVEDALAANDATEKRLALLKERVDATGSTLRLSTDRYLQGLSNYLPVLTAQVLHFDARSQLLSERRQLISDRVTLVRALGGRWKDEQTVRKGAGNRVTSQQSREKNIHREDVQK